MVRKYDGSQAGTGARIDHRHIEIGTERCEQRPRQQDIQNDTGSEQVNPRCCALAAASRVPADPLQMLDIRNGNARQKRRRAIQNREQCANAPCVEEGALPPGAVLEYEPAQVKARHEANADADRTDVKEPRGACRYEGPRKFGPLVDESLERQPQRPDEGLRLSGFPFLQHEGNPGCQSRDAGPPLSRPRPPDPPDDDCCINTQVPREKPDERDSEDVDLSAAVQRGQSTAEHNACDQQYTGNPRDAGVAAQHAFDEWEPGDERREKRSRACDEHALGASRKTGAACSDVLRIQ